MHRTLSQLSGSTRSDWPVSWLDTNTCFVEVLLERYRALSIKMEPAGSQCNLKLHPTRLFMSYRHILYIYVQKCTQSPCISGDKKHRPGGAVLFFTLSRHNLSHNLSPLPAPILISNREVCRRPRRQYKLMEQQNGAPEEQSISLKNTDCPHQSPKA